MIITAGDVNSYSSVLPNTRAWEQQESNKTNETDEGKKRDVSTERSKGGTKKKEVPTAYHSLPNENTIKINIK